MLRFPSDEWIKAFMQAVNENKAYEEAARDWEGDFVFVVKPEGNLKEEVAFYVDLWHGKCRAAYQLKSRDEKQAAYVYEGTYGNWIKLIEGKIDPIQGLLTGKFKLKGNMMKIMRYTKAASELVKTASKIPTEFL